MYFGNDMQVWYIADSEEKRILVACHNGNTSGYMDTKRTLARITERFIQPGVSSDVCKFVS